MEEGWWETDEMSVGLFSCFLLLLQQGAPPTSWSGLCLCASGHLAAARHHPALAAGKERDREKDREREREREGERGRKRERERGGERERERERERVRGRNRQMYR